MKALSYLHSYFFGSIPFKGTTLSLAEVIVDFNTLRGTELLILTHKTGYDDRSPLTRAGNNTRDWG